MSDREALQAARNALLRAAFDLRRILAELDAKVVLLDTRLDSTVPVIICEAGE